MNQEKIIQLKQGLSTALINQNNSSNSAYKPQFVSNNYKEGRKVISSIEDEFLSCEEFAISVAFITMGGITPLIQTLRELEQIGVPGKILTTDYLTFSDPKALRILAKFKNIELKMFVTQNGKEGFHMKGYIFQKEEMYRLQLNSMQVGFINNLRKIYEFGEDRALLISATGAYIILKAGENPYFIRVWSLSFLFYASSHENAVLAQAFEEHRNNYEKLVARVSHG